jgi:NhaP-type Na+/H+ or K+/H+ antiporter
LDRSIGFFRSFDASWRFPSEDVWNTLLTVFGLLLIGVLCTVAGFGIGFFFFFPFAVMVLTVQYILRTGQPIAVSGTGGERGE